MPIECAFGILIQRWGVLYKPLRVDFRRRAPLIAACMRLHNLCIDLRIADDTHDEQGITRVNCDERGGGRWAATPAFDRDGAPLAHLDIEVGPRLRHPTAAGESARLVTRDRLMRAIKDAGLERPHTLPAHMHRRQKRRGGGGKKKRKRS